MYKSFSKLEDQNFKNMEKESMKREVICPDEGFVIRLNGHKFSRFTKKFFRKPFDPLFNQVMMMTLQDLMFHFNPAIGFVQSDEISLFFTSQPDTKGGRQPHARGGRMLKIITHASSFCSVRFNKNLDIVFSKHQDIEGISSPLGTESEVTPYFDARIIIFKGDIEKQANHVMYYFENRSIMHGACNFIHSNFVHYFGNKTSHGLTTTEKTKRLQFTHIPRFALHGCFAKFKRFIKRGTAMKYGSEPIETYSTRRRIRLFTCNITHVANLATERLYKTVQNILTKKDIDENFEMYGM